MENLLDKSENIIIIGAVGIFAYIMIRSGVGLKTLKGIDDVFSGKVGERTAEFELHTGTVKQGGAPITLGQVAVQSNPITFIPNLIRAWNGTPPIGAPQLNLTATDAAFAKIGMTTAGVVKLQNTAGVNYPALQLRLINNTLSESDRALLFSAGWDGTCQYWYGGGTNYVNASDPNRAPDLYTLPSGAKSIVGGAR